MRFRLPPELASFAAVVREAQREVAEACLRDEAPSFPDLWGRFKHAFVEAQHNKCGYCEVILSACTGALDHYRPKAGLDELPVLRSQHGREVDTPLSHASNVVGRALVRVSERGYPWAAYLWINYILCCERCNSAWKRCLFPVAERPRSLPPVEGAVETPLLLNPFEPENPAEHLAFDPFGQITARDGSLRGQATIDTCGLWRPTLVAQRMEEAQSAHALLVAWHDASTAEAEERAYRDIAAAGAPAMAHAGMVRAIFEENTGERWEAVFG